jgi:hypothetical protein
MSRYSALRLVLISVPGNLTEPRGVVRSDVRFDLYVWRDPRDLDADSATELIDGWLAAGGDPAMSPFEPSSDVGWFLYELKAEAPHLEVVSDGLPSDRSGPIWVQSSPEAPARIVAVQLPPDADEARDALETIVGLATKYDLLLFDPKRHQLHRPLELMAAYASATFWPAGAIRAGVVGLIGLLVATVGFLSTIPVVGWALVLVGGFVALMAVVTFFHEGRAALRRRR